MSTTTIPVTTPSASYTIEIGANLLPLIGHRLDTLLHGNLASGKQRAFLITSPEILRLHGPALLSGLPTAPTILEVPPGESHKRLATVELLLEALAHHGADRDSILIALGGGVLGDMTGFLASIYMRGIRYIGVPTTALAQIDSSLGGKTGVNLAAGKNLAGAFHHPLAVYSDIATLATLPPDELRAGLQEAVKAGIILDRALFDYMETHASAILAGDPAALTHVIAASVQVKASVVSQDEKESGLRMLLNLGHTLGHAIEAATEYKQLLHGEAIAWGMLAAINIASKRGLLKESDDIWEDDADRMISLICRYGPLKHFSAKPAELVALTAKDKKNRSGTRSFILPTTIGAATVVHDVTDAELLSAATQITREAAAIEALA